MPWDWASSSALFAVRAVEIVRYKAKARKFTFSIPKGSDGVFVLMPEE